jgi:hypothetical protein
LAAPKPAGRSEAPGGETFRPSPTNLMLNREHKGPGRHCQTNLTGRAKGADLKRSGCKLTPLNQGGRAVLFEDGAGVEVTAEVEVVVD